MLHVQSRYSGHLLWRVSNQDVEPIGWWLGDVLVLGTWDGCHHCGCPLKLGKWSQGLLDESVGLGDAASYLCHQDREKYTDCSKVALPEHLHSKKWRFTHASVWYSRLQKASSNNLDKVKLRIVTWCAKLLDLYWLARFKFKRLWCAALVTEKSIVSRVHLYKAWSDMLDRSAKSPWLYPLVRTRSLTC